MSRQQEAALEHGDFHMGSACETSGGAVGPQEMVRLVLAHPDFLEHRKQEREFMRSVCADVVDSTMAAHLRNAKIIAGLFVGLTAYIFTSSMNTVHEASTSIKKLNDSVIELTVAVEAMKNQAVRLQQENDRNRDGIDRLREQIYRK